jgi:hypothetical protein
VRRADHSSRGVLPTVSRHCVRSRNLTNEEAMARVGPQCQIKKNMRRIIQVNRRNFSLFLYVTTKSRKVKGKTIPVQAWTDLEGSRRLRLPDRKTIGT